MSLWQAVRFVGTYAVNAPILDQWDPITLFWKQGLGELSFGDFWAQNGENRMLFPKLLMVGLAHLTHYDVVAEVYVFLGALVVILVLLLVAVRQSFGVLSPLAAVVPILLFYPRQWENFIPGIQVLALAFVLPGALLAFFLLSMLPGSRRWPLLFAGALVAASLASFAAAAGLVAWPAGALVLFLQRARRKWELLALWLGVAAAETVVYLHGLQTLNDGRPKAAFLIDKPGAALDYAMTLLGASLIGSGGRVAFACGIVVTTAAALSFALVAWNRAAARSAFWVALIVFSLGLTALVTTGRAGFGTVQAFSSRYATLTLPSVLGTTMLLGYLALRGRSGRLLAQAGVVVLFGWIAFGAFNAFDDATQAARAERDDRQRIAFALLTDHNEPDAVLVHGRYPDPGVIREFGSLIVVVRLMLPVLAHRQYSVFAPAERSRILPPPLRTLRAIRRRSNCYVDSINGAPTNGTRDVFVPKAGVLVVQGWCVDQVARASAGGVYLEVDRRRYPARYGIERPDLVSGFGGESYRYSGFERFLELPPETVKNAEHTISVIAVAHDKRRYYAPLPALRAHVVG